MSAQGKAEQDFQQEYEKAIERIRTFGAFGPALVPVSQRPGDRLLAFTGRRAGD